MRPVAQLVERWAPGQEPRFASFPRSNSTPGGDGRRSAAGTARGPDEAGEWGGPCPVVGARKTSDLDFAGQQKLRERTVEFRAGEQTMPSAGRGLAEPSIKTLELNYLKGLFIGLKGTILV